MKHLKLFKTNEISSPAGSIDIDISGMSALDRHNNANPAIELEEEIDVKKLNVYKASAEGMDMIYYIVAAESLEEVQKIVSQESGNYVDIDDIFQIEKLQTDKTTSGIIISF